MSEDKLNNFGVVILAAGKGTRLNCTDMPKVMLPIGGKPIVSYIVDTLENMGFKPEQICMVVGFKEEKIMEYFGDRVSYAHQKKKLGTAHAAYTGILQLPNYASDVLVVQGDDSAFYSEKNLMDFINKHLSAGVKLSLLSVKVQDPSMLGRIVRHSNGDIEVVEKEYLTEEQKKINEISTGTFCFDRNWYEDIFPRMPQLRKLGEWGLPASLAMAREENVPYQVIELQDSRQWFGVNTSRQLKEADRRKKNEDG